MSLPQQNAQLSALDILQSTAPLHPQRPLAHLSMSLRYHTKEGRDNDSDSEDGSRDHNASSVDTRPASNQKTSASDKRDSEESAESSSPEKWFNHTNNHVL